MNEIEKTIDYCKGHIKSLEEKQKREQGCKYCKVPYKDIIDIILGESVNGEEVHLFINTDGQNLRLYDNLPDNPKTDTLKLATVQCAEGG
ncbi:hypothetical protein [Ruminiclostridium hungatei]|uniref:hypothetical protein n=1 Tax=Ruminiclostridium hungatei TaxID=48256 RepID=UPI0009ACCBF7|nr:hypothetical protein [Ruminiclostridium hungatei]